MSQLAIDTFHQQPEEIVKLNQWLFENIQPYIKGRTLEMGSGSGVFSSLLMHDGARLYLSDLDKARRDLLRERFKDAPGLREVYKIDFSRSDFEQRYAPMIGTFSTIISLNFAEQGCLGKPSLDNAKILLRNGGHLITVLPAATAIYPGVEQNIDEIKKYNWTPLKLLLNRFNILKTRYFNLGENVFSTFIQPSQLLVLVMARKVIN